MKTKIFSIIALVMSVILLASCSSDAEIPDGYQDATCNGELFRLFVPTQWNLNTQSGISSAYASINDNITVNMIQGRAVGKSYEDATDGEGDPVEGETVEISEPISDYWAETVAEYRLSMQSFKLLKEGVPVTMGGKAAKAYQFTCNRGEQEYKYYQVTAVHKGYFFTFTYCAPTVNYDTYEEAVDGMVDNVIFYNQPFEVLDTRAVVEDEDAPDGMVRVSDDTVAYRFYAPSDWKIDPNSGQSVVYFSEDDKSNVSAMAQMPSTGSGILLLNEYIDTVRKEYRETFTDFEVISETADGELTVDGRAAVRSVYRAAMGGVTYRIDQTAIIKGEMIYLITYTATEDKFDLHTDDVQRMIDAYRFR